MIKSKSWYTFLPYRPPPNLITSKLCRKPLRSNSLFHILPQSASNSAKIHCLIRGREKEGGGGWKKVGHDSNAINSMGSLSNNKTALSGVRDSTCAFKSYHLSLHRCSCIPSLPRTRSPFWKTQQRKKKKKRKKIKKTQRNEWLRKHVALPIRRVQQCSVQAQIMFIITAHWLHQPPGNTCWGKWDARTYTRSPTTVAAIKQAR